MRQGRASRTAEHNALFRALESSRPEGRRRFQDPLAAAFLSAPLSVVDRLARLPGVRSFVPWFIDRRWPGVRTSVVARTRLIDDAIESSLGEGFEQGERARKMRGHELYRVALAHVAPDASRCGAPVEPAAWAPGRRG